MTQTLKAPFPYFGGKSKIASEVWRRFGKTDRYIEPFFGSGAVMLANPNWRETKEIVNDVNHYIANVWRSLRFDPETVAYYCDAPTIEIEMHLQHIWLVNEGRNRIAACEYDDSHYDAEVAGKWLLGMANWIGSHYAAGTGGWTKEMLKAASELGTYDLRDILRQRPHLSNDGRGVNRQLPHLSYGQGVNRQRPHLSDDGQGVNRQRPHLSDDGREFVDTFFPKNEALYQYIRQFAERLVEVDVCCGNWERIVKPAVTLADKDTSGNGTAAIFFDPPYSAEANRASVYTYENFSVAHGVREWCKKHGDNPRMRIAICGYDVEHHELENYGWEAYSWSANGGYSTFANKDNQSHTNKRREVVWFSPHCVTSKADRPDDVQERLF